MSDKKIDSASFFMSNKEIEEINRQNELKRQEYGSGDDSGSSSAHDAASGAGSQPERKPVDRPLGSKHSKEGEKESRRWFGRKDRKADKPKHSKQAGPAAKTDHDSAAGRSVRQEDNSGSDRSVRSTGSIASERPGRPADNSAPDHLLRPKSNSSIDRPVHPAENSTDDRSAQASGRDSANRSARRDGYSTPNRSSQPSGSDPGDRSERPSAYDPADRSAEPARKSRVERFVRLGRRGTADRTKKTTDRNADTPDSTASAPDASRTADRNAARDTSQTASGNTSRDDSRTAARSTASAAGGAHDKKPETAVPAEARKKQEQIPSGGAKKSFSLGRNFTIILAIFLILLAVGGFKLVLRITEPDISYAAGTSAKVRVFTEDEAKGSELVPAGSVTRGSRIIVSNRKITRGDETYRRFKTEDGEERYLRDSDLASTLAEAVREEEVWVRTPVTIYEKSDGPAIASFAPKGSRLVVEGYDKLMTNGIVNKYAVEYTNDDGETVSGYVYGKYMSDSEEAALKSYNKHRETSKAKKDKYSFDLYGGKAENLDYYPHARPVITGNEFLSDARAMYINSYAAVHPEAWLKIINETDCNAVVIDIKDGNLTYTSEVAKELSPTSYRNAYAEPDELKEGVQQYQEAGLYTIGRIVVFNDPYYAKDHPEDCIKYGSDTSWPSAYSRGVWEYNVRLAQEAIREFGFNEIQFDYVRFPEATYDMSKSGYADFRNKYGEEKAQAVQNFCLYAADQIHEEGAYFSIDVFGESVYGYVTAYGQYWPALTNVVDAISAMPYTDHTGGDGAWEHPYKTLLVWGKKAKSQQDRIMHPAAARTWITGYDTPYWAPTKTYGEKELKAQIKGLKDAGLKGGFIPWNVLCDTGKYNRYKAIWNE